MKRLIRDGDPLRGSLVWDPLKSSRLLGGLLIGGIGLSQTFTWLGVGIGNLATLMSMYVGVIAYHRLLFHRSFQTPRWVERSLVLVANLSAIGGPSRLVETHDLRDWAQRKPACHPFLANRGPFLGDWMRQLFYRLDLHRAPVFEIETRGDPLYRHLDRAWLLYQIPLGAILFLLGGWAAVFTGVFLKWFFLPAGFSLVSYCIHNFGQRPIENESAGTQGGNVRALALISFGESHHNNHHLYPEAAITSFRTGEVDPAGWLIVLLERLGLAEKVKRIDWNELGNSKVVVTPECR